MTEENDAYCWFISVTKHSNTDWNSIVDSESMMYTANNYLMVNYSTFIILMIIIKTPGMFFVQCFTATSVTDLRWRSLIRHCLGVELFVRRDSQSFIANLCPHPSSSYRSAKIPSPSRPFSTRFYVQRIKTHDFFLSIYIDWYSLGNLRCSDYCFFVS